MSITTFNSKLPTVGTSIFTVMSALAREENALNLSQGFPDFTCDPEITRLVTHWMNQGANQYAPSSGILVLREKIARLVSEFYSANYDPDTEITITSGGTEALFCAIASVVHDGDEVIIFEPAYDSYAPAIELNGGIPVHIPLNFPGYGIDWEAVKKCITQKTKLIILNSPQNPTGAVLSTQDMAQLEKIVLSNSMYLISDEVYEHIIFDQIKHQSLARFPKLAARSFIISSFGKSFHVTGWKVGYCLAPKELTAEFRKIHQYVTFSTITPVQMAFADYMSDLNRFKMLAEFYQQKRDLFLSQLKGSKWKPLACHGTYFQLLDYSAITKEKDTDFAIRLTKEFKIASIPVSVFYNEKIDHHVLRFCFAKGEETLKKAGEVLCRVVK